MKDLTMICSECGQSVEWIEGHPRNWPRSLVSRHATLKAALEDLLHRVDKYNQEFAIREFSEAAQEKFSVGLLPPEEK